MASPTTAPVPPIHVSLHSSDIATWLTVVATAAAALAAFEAVRVARRFGESAEKITSSQRNIASTDLLFRYSGQFYSSPKLLTNRRRFAESWLKGNPEDTSAVELLNFFEGVATLVEENCVTPKMVWGDIGFWIHRYWYACTKAIEYHRQDDPNVWESVQRLNTQLEEISANRGSSQDASAPSHQVLHEFMDEEAHCS